jgi:hypothetical protein
MLSEDELRRDIMRTHLCELMRAACHDQGASVEIYEMPPRQEGSITISSIGGHESPVANINVSLEMDRAEAAVLHEAGHWLEGNEVFGSEANRAYEAAKAYDDAHDARTRGPFEQAADCRALTILGEGEVLSLLETDPWRIADLLVEDAEQYGAFERGRLDAG